MGKTVHFPLLACLLVSACGTDNPEDMRTKLMQSWGQEILLSNYESFVEATATLSTGAESLCDGPTAKKLEDLQETWWKARAPWKRMDAFNFGPYTDEPLRLGPKIDFWPARISAIDALLAGNGKITEQSLAEGGAANRGMPVVEYLLYADAAKDVALWKDAPRRCDYLLASTADLHTNAERMHEAWSPLEGNYLRNLVDAGQANTAFMDPQAALGEVVNRMAFLVENIRSMKLTKPLGTEGKRSPDTVESRFSGRSVEDIRDNLSGIATL
ncbi:MAG: imelysin family protein, partial [Myxococcales bacterium]|nr:imelysin family protein [Myxococcales bacterium]